jgi:hypothetical protein
LPKSVDDLVEDLRGMSASCPASRDAVVQRLRGTIGARKLYTGRPKTMLAAFAPGKITAPKMDADLGAFAYALQGLPDDFAQVEEIRPVILECLERDKEEKHRPAIYRAAARVDEILHRQRN